MNEQDMSPDLRLRTLAGGSLAGYRAGSVSLRRLIDDLNTVWNNVSSSEWSNDFRGHWWTLEQIYAVALDRGQLDAMPSESLAAIDEAVTSLEALLNSWPKRHGMR